jgi:hypothetical protein
MPQIEDFERLPDESDMATVREGQFLAAALEQASKTQHVQPTGFCLDPNCGERFLSDKQIKAYRKTGFPNDAKRFCGTDCRDGWERYQRMKKITGGA